MADEGDAMAILTSMDAVMNIIMTEFTQAIEAGKALHPPATSWTGVDLDARARIRQQAQEHVS